MSLQSPPACSASAIAHQVWTNLLPYAIPDSRFNFDFSKFTPDFRDCSAAIDRLVALSCFEDATTIFIGPDNSLQNLRFRALKLGKIVLTTSHAIRRGFWFLDPRRISEDKYEIASLLDGMEMPRIGRPITLAQLREEGITIELGITGAAAVNTKGQRLSKGYSHFNVAWGILIDMRVVDADTPIATVVDERQLVDNEDPEVWTGSCNLIITPKRVMSFDVIAKLRRGIIGEELEPNLIETIPPLQELKGIQMMENIMQRTESVATSNEQGQRMPSEHELMAIQMVENLMKGYKP